MTGAAASARRAAWGFLDQALSSLINFGVGFLVARTVTGEHFGAFSIGFAVNVAFVVTTRALASEPFLIRHSHEPLPQWRQAVGAATGVALTIGALGGIALLVVGLLIGGLIGEAFVPLAFVLPGLVLQDSMRFAFIARGRPVGAFLADLGWLTLLVPALVLVQQLGASSITMPIIVWGGSAMVTAAVALSIARVAPSPRAALAWWRRHRDIGPRYVAEGLISLAASQTTVLAVGILAGLAAAGGLRGAQLLLGPMQVLLMGIGIIAIPEGVEIRRRRGMRGLTRTAIIVSGAVGGAAIVYGALLTLIPDDTGRFLLGETWTQARTILLPMSMAYAGVASGLGAGIGLRVLADARRSLRARAIDASAQSMGGIGGAAAIGIAGAASGLALGASVGSVVIWLHFRASARQQQNAEEAGDVDGPAAAISPDRAPTPGPVRREGG